MLVKFIIANKLYVAKVVIELLLHTQLDGAAEIAEAISVIRDAFMSASSSSFIRATLRNPPHSPLFPTHRLQIHYTSPSHTSTILEILILIHTQF